MIPVVLRSHSRPAVRCRSLLAALLCGAVASATLAGCSGATQRSNDRSTTVPKSTEPSSGSDADQPFVRDLCGRILPDEVGAIVGGPVTVTVEEHIGGGCAFNQEDPQAPSASLLTIDPGDEADAVFNEARSVFSNLPTPTFESPAVGQRAEAASGTVFGSEVARGAGLAQIGRTIVVVTVVQDAGLDGDAVRAMVVALLQLADRKL